MRSGLSLGAKRNRYLAMGGWAGEDGGSGDPGGNPRFPETCSAACLINSSPKARTSGFDLGSQPCLFCPLAHGAPCRMLPKESAGTLSPRQWHQCPRLESGSVVVRGVSEWMIIL